MNIKIIESLLKKLYDVEKLILEIESSIDKVSPDLQSTINAKINLIGILKGITVTKDDINGFLNGKSIMTQEDIINTFLGKKKNLQLPPFHGITEENKEEDKE
jgi:hypothetical protein